MGSRTARYEKSFVGGVRTFCSHNIYRRVIQKLNNISIINFAKIFTKINQKNCEKYTIHFCPICRNN